MQSSVDRVSSSADSVQSCVDRVQSSVDRVSSSADSVQSCVDRVQSSADSVQSSADSVQSSADRVWHLVPMAFNRVQIYHITVTQKSVG